MLQSVVTIILGLFFLSILIIIHELGHFLMAKVASIKVLIFSIGWGKKIFSRQIGNTLWVVSLLPLGGYCKMAGEESSLESEPQPGDLGYGKPWRRVLTVVGGPLFSLLFALLLFMVSTMMSYQTIPIDGKIIVTASSEKEFIDGDIIIAINNKEIVYGHEWKQLVSASARQELLVTLLRKGEEISFTKEIEILDDGRGYIAIDHWMDPIIGTVSHEGSAYRAGILPGDRIVSINSIPILHAVQMRNIINKYASEPLNFVIERLGKVIQVGLSATYSSLSDSYFIGITFKQPNPIRVKGLSLWQAPAEGFKEFYQNAVGYLKSLENLFHGVKLQKAVSGPLQMTYILGSVAQQSMATDGRNIVFFMAFISLILGMMNLLPIPLLDGGLIMLYLLEAIKGSAMGPSFLRLYQLIGMTFIMFFIAVALFSDFLSFFR